MVSLCEKGAIHLPSLICWSHILFAQKGDVTKSSCLTLRFDLLNYTGHVGKCLECHSDRVVPKFSCCINFKFLLPLHVELHLHQHLVHVTRAVANRRISAATGAKVLLGHCLLSSSLMHSGFADGAPSNIANCYSLWLL